MRPMQVQEETKLMWRRPVTNTAGDTLFNKTLYFHFHPTKNIVQKKYKKKNNKTTAVTKKQYEQIHCTINYFHLD